MPDPARSNHTHRDGQSDEDMLARTENESSSDNASVLSVDFSPAVHPTKSEREHQGGSILQNAFVIVETVIVAEHQKHGETVGPRR